jgi:putative oxygen-independent coproporphyrinogen III oxidase
MPLGLYLSIPFCRTKCSYCNFASDVFSRAVFGRYVDRVCADIHSTPETARQMGGRFETDADSLYLGGGTPTVLDSQQLERLFVTVKQQFRLQPETEVTVECAPGTLTPEVLATLLRCGVNRVSLGVQSFVDQEAASVGRLHKRSTVLDDIVRLRRAGISNINVDLIAGLPHQTAESWRESVEAVIALGVPHVSVYMLEVDEDSRLGRELIAGGTKYHAHFVPDEELTADLYEAACARLNAAGIAQYEISNFAREGFESRHNLKYWTRQPYLGFGVDAHSMLASAGGELDAVRFSSADSLEQYVAGAALNRTEVSRQAALEESFFLGLRLNEGVDLAKMRDEFGTFVVTPLRDLLVDLAGASVIEWEGDRLRLTRRGRLLSNEVFERFLGCGAGTPAR